MIFHGDEGARVFPMRVLWNEEQQDWVPSRGQYMRNAQSKNVMITQQCRRWLQQNPDWFPCVDMIGYDIGIYFGTNLDEMLEKEGWIFVGEENAYLAVRIIQSDRHEKFKVGRDETGTSLTASLIEESYEWNKAHTLVKMNDKYSAVIFEAASKDDFKSIDDFAASILDNELTIGKTVVPGWITVTYRPDNGDEIYFNAANNELPRINGQAVDYAPKKTFDSPFISGMYGKPSVNIYYNDKKQKTIKID
jgi:hypothetical protein